MTSNREAVASDPLRYAMIQAAALRTVERLENATPGMLFGCEADREEAVEIIADGFALAPPISATETVVETVARAIFEADEDLNDAQEARLRREGKHAAADCLSGPRARWDDPKNAPILDAFRARARAAIQAHASLFLTPEA